MASATSTRLRRLVLLTGVTGVDVGAVLEHASRVFNVPTAKFEDFVEEVFKAPIYYVAELLLANYKSASERLAKAFQRMLDYLSGEAREGRAVIAMHLSYYRRRNIIPNPMTLALPDAADEIVIINYVDDYYHALQRILERTRSGQTPSVARGQALDPLGLLYWRAVDHNIATMASARFAEALIFGNKHSREMHTRLLSYALRLEYRGVSRYRTAYISHPITKVREKALAENTALPSFRDALEIEEFKSVLERRCRDLIIFSPTSIDELITDKHGDLVTRIRREDRWPHPEGLHDNYVYPVDLGSEEFNKYLYPVESTVANQGYRAMLKSIIESQIESRDLSYIAQADMVVAYRPTLYNTIHIGVETEIRAAYIQAKPVYALVPPEDEPRAYQLFSFEYIVESIDELTALLNCGG